MTHTLELPQNEMSHYIKLCLFVYLFIRVLWLNYACGLHSSSLNNYFCHNHGLIGDETKTGKGVTPYSLQNMRSSCVGARTIASYTSRIAINPNGIHWYTKSEWSQVFTT
jgi:hypothetical protein